MKEANSIISAIGLAEEKLGLHDHNMRRDRPYTGQPWTDSGIRGATEIKGITFRDLKDAFIRALIHSSDYTQPPNSALQAEADKGELAALSPGDVYSIQGDLDFMAVSQNLSCEIEKMMGIFPNINLPGIPSSTQIMNDLFGENRTEGDVIIPGVAEKTVVVRVRKPSK